MTEDSEFLGGTERFLPLFIFGLLIHAVSTEEVC